MNLTPREKERLDLYLAAELARRRFRHELKLNYPEAVAIICDELVEQARFGKKSLAEVIALGRRIITKEDVMPGVEELLKIVQVEGLFNDGTKLITIHDPIAFSTREEIKQEAYLTL